MTVNQELFQKIESVITEFPMLHHQRYWEANDTEENGSCGTTRCIAGWAVWFKAVELGLVSRKRDPVDNDMLHQVAEHMGVDVRDPDYGDFRSDAALYTETGAKLLGLDHDTAYNLFNDLVDKRAVARVTAFATTGADISNEEFDRLV